jgi:DNA-binding response OmpR family regulator
MEILFVADDDNEAFSFKEAVHSVSTDIKVSHISYCIDLLILIKTKKPDLVFLGMVDDENNGLFYLRAIRALKELGNLPVIMYSFTKNERQIENAYKARANYYMVKPDSVSETISNLSYFIATQEFMHMRTSRELFVRAGA